MSKGNIEEANYWAAELACWMFFGTLGNYNGVSRSQY